jgi:hypothetical protein
MNETGVMLSMPGSVKVLVGKDDTRDYRGARVKRTTVTAIEYISADNRYLNPMIIWPATTHRSNWTTFSTPEWQYACSESEYTDSKISLEWLKRGERWIHTFSRCSLSVTHSLVTYEQKLR